jgi:ADP-ribose pyrophosphatase YjhB (NUDIX family)
MYKVFINDKPLIITDSFQQKNYSGKVLELNYRNEGTIEEAESLLNNSNYLAAVVILCKNINDVWEEFCKRYQLIEAAGGMVVNKNAELLIIFRNRKWDLPKGKVEKNESYEIAALREVNEECGIDKIELGNKLTVVFHTYAINQKKILKKTHWYWMKWSGDEVPKPQVEEGISEIVFRDAKNVEDILTNTYQSIAELIKLFQTNFSRQ